jgi:hypothetical protein
MSGILITKLVRHVEPINIDGMTVNSVTIGHVIDEMIGMALHKGEEVHSIELRISPEDWITMVRGFNPDKASPAKPKR